MKVLVACENSGVVRDAFIARGHEAMSCDLVDSPGPHYQGDVMDVLYDGWDLMVAHPPCRYLAVSGARWFAERPDEQADALRFVQALMDAPIDKIAIENPVSVISTRVRKPDQIIQPWQFGHDEAKRTCLWLKNLPPLVDTNNVKRPKGERYSNQTPSGQNKLGPSPTRAAVRARTYEGVAKAMAEQWG